MATVRAILFDAAGLLYERPALGVALQTLLDHYGLKPRHPTVVHNALRAASFDANVGRISLDEFYNAVLRVHGLSKSQALAAGREALRFDAGRLTLPSGTAAVLRRLQQAGLELGALVNTPYTSADEMAWLARLGVPPEIWTIYITSCESGALAPGPLLINSAVKQLETTPESVILVSSDPGFLESAAEQGLIPVAYQPTGQIAVAHASIDQLAQLLPLVAASL